MNGVKKDLEIDLREDNFLTTNKDLQKTSYFTYNKGVLNGFKIRDGKKPFVEFDNFEKLDSILVTQHYPFNSRNDLFVVGNPNQSIIFSSKGDLKAAFKSNGSEVSLLSFEAKNETVIYYCEGNRIRKLTF